MFVLYIFYPTTLCFCIATFNLFRMLRLKLKLTFCNIIFFTMIFHWNASRSLKSFKNFVRFEIYFSKLTSFLFLFLHPLVSLWLIWFLSVHPFCHLMHCLYNYFCLVCIYLSISLSFMYHFCLCMLLYCLLMTLSAFSCGLFFSLCLFFQYFLCLYYYSTLTFSSKCMQSHSINARFSCFQIE